MKVFMRACWYCFYLFLLTGTLNAKGIQEGGCRFWGFSLRKAPSYENFVKMGMDIWTNLDLVRAIYTTPEQKNEICGELIKMIQALCKEFKVIKKYIEVQHTEELYALIETIKIAFCDLFDKHTHSAYTQTVLLLNELLEHLKVPNQVTS